MAAPAVRPAQPADVPAMSAIAAEAYAVYVERIGRKPAPMVADFASHVADGEAYVLEDGGAVAGYIVTFEKQGGQFIENVAVDPGRQGHGHGKRLLDFCEGEARRRGLGRLFLYTNIHITENLDFYPALGYVETHRVREDGFDRVYFEKVLA
jgi:ribosomal protein S18 acetylase RimI-like enzyme